MSSIPHFSIGSAALIIFLICAAFVILRGITRVLIGATILTISAWLGFLMWQYSPSLSVAWFGKAIGPVTTGFPIVTFVCTFLVLRYTIKFLTKPLGDEKQEEPKRKPQTRTRIAFALVFTLAPTCILFVITIALLHHIGSVAELKHHANPEAQPTKFSTFARSVKDSVDDTLPEAWVHALDPLAEKSRLTLAKVITTQSEPKLALIVDPTTNEPIPRAIIVEDAEVNHLVEEGKFGTLLRHPVITDVLKKPGVQEFLKHLQL